MNTNKKSWKTTLSGVGVILAALGAGIKAIVANDLPTAITVIIGGVSGGIGLIKARDDDKSSEDVGAK